MLSLILKKKVKLKELKNNSCSIKVAQMYNIFEIILYLKCNKQIFIRLKNATICYSNAKKSNRLRLKTIR